MHKTCIVIVLIFLMLGCQKEKNITFLITENSVGKLNRSTTLDSLDTIYATDSIVRDTSKPTFGSKTGKIKIFEKGGKHLLTVTPDSDSIPHIENIRIFDPRFTTEKGVGLKSTFKDIKDHYTIKKVVTSMNNVVIFVKDSDAYFTISKEELPSSLRYASSTNIEAVQIPDKAKIKYLMVGWD